MVRTSRVVPKEWSKHSPIGTVIPRTRFIVFKTPLSTELSTRLPPQLRFTTNHLFRIMAERGESLGMIMDLTDTNRYYDKKDVLGMCIEYEKLFCPGRNFLEREDAVKNFNAAMQRYMEKCTDPHALIGVHCTRGVNRSGYLVCRFLIDCLGWSSHEAIEAFETARGYPIAKGDYISALHRAAKENKNRPRRNLRDSDSGESQEERKKRKRKRKDEDDLGGNEMGDMIKHFLGTLGQEAEQLEAESPAIDSPSQWTAPVQWMAPEQTPPEAEEEEEGGEEAEDEEMEEWTAEGGRVDGYVPDDEKTTAQKRRARRNRLQKYFHVMKRGRFSEIQEIQKERFGTP